MLLIGSCALDHWFIVGRPIKDYDFIATYEEFKTYVKDKSQFVSCKPINSGKKFVLKSTSGSMWEFEIAWPGTTAEELLSLDAGVPIRPSLADLPYKVANLNTLYALKMSHRYRKNSPHFLKTMQDIHTMREHGAVIPPELQEWFKRREAETYDYKHPVLNQAKKDFFSGDGVNYVYDHDEIHVAVAHLDLPAYKYYQKDDAQVMTSKTKFFAVPNEARLLGVLEEAYVLALERHQIPNNFKPNPKASFDIALEKICTSITSGWFREFSWENYYKVQGLYSDNYVQKFKQHFGVE